MLTLSPRPCPPPDSLVLHDGELNLGKERRPEPHMETAPPTPDVDLLLECTFSYLHNAQQHDEQEKQPMEEQEEEFLNSQIGPEEEEEVGFLLS